MRLAFWIASKNLAFRRIQSAAAMLGVAVGIATVCAVQIVDYNTIRGAREHHRRHTGNPDLVASVRDQRRWAETGVRAHLERRDEVDLAMPIFESSAIVATSTGRPAGAQLTALDMAAASEFDPWRLASGSAPAGAREALIGARLAEEIGASTGETIALRRPAATATGCAMYGSPDLRVCPSCSAWANSKALAIASLSRSAVPAWCARRHSCSQSGRSSWGDVGVGAIASINTWRGDRSTGVRSRDAAHLKNKWRARVAHL